MQCNGGITCVSLLSEKGLIQKHLSILKKVNKKLKFAVIISHADF